MRLNLADQFSKVGPISVRHENFAGPDVAKALDFMGELTVYLIMMSHPTVFSHELGRRRSTDNSHSSSR